MLEFQEVVGRWSLVVRESVVQRVGQRPTTNDQRHYTANCNSEEHS